MIPLFPKFPILLMTLTHDMQALLEKRLSSFDRKVKQEHVGTVISIGDGIARIDGLSNVGYSEMIDFGNGVIGSALSLEEGSVGAAIFGDYSHVRQGDTVKAMGKVLSVPVGEGLIGRVVSPLGVPKDGGPPIAAKAQYPVEKIAPGVIERKSVTMPLQTGITAIDAAIPIGRGQRE